MTSKTILFLMIGAVLIGFGINRLIFAAKIESYCEFKDDPEECECAIKYIIDNVAQEHRKEILKTLSYGYIKPNPDVIVAGFQAAVKCMK